MKKKLTKNVSQKLTDEKLALCIEHFESILYKWDLLYDYYFEFAIQHDNKEREQVFIQWKQWAKSTYPEYWISQAFLFEKTDRLALEWIAIDNLWNLWLVQNKL